MSEGRALPIRGWLPRRGLGLTVCAWSLISLAQGLDQMAHWLPPVRTSVVGASDWLELGQLSLATLGAIFGSWGGWMLYRDRRRAVPVVLLGLGGAGAGYLLGEVSLLVVPSSVVIGAGWLDPLGGIALMAIAAYAVLFAASGAAEPIDPARDRGRRLRAVGLLLAAWFAVSAVTSGANAGYLLGSYWHFLSWPLPRSDLLFFGQPCLEFAGGLLCAGGGWLLWRSHERGSALALGGLAVLLGAQLCLLGLGGQFDWLGFLAGLAYLGLVAVVLLRSGRPRAAPPAPQEVPVAEPGP